MCGNPESQLAVDRIVKAIRADAQRTKLASVVERLCESPSFCVFLQKHERTIAKELRNQKTLEDCFDVVAELELASLLSRDVADMDYQVRLHSGSKRLDFLLHFPSGDSIGVEVKRIRDPDSVRQLHGNTSYEIPYTQRESFKFTDRILESLSQLRSGLPNIVYVKVSSTTHELSDASEALHFIVARCRRGDEQFFKKKGFSGRKDFYEQYRKMSAVVVRPKYIPLSGHEPAGYTRNRFYANPDAQFEVPDSIAELFRNADICI